MVNGTVVGLSDTSITWIDGTTEFFVFSEEMTRDELVAVYESMVTPAEK